MKYVIVATIIAVALSATICVVVISDRSVGMKFIFEFQSYPAWEAFIDELEEEQGMEKEMIQETAPQKT